MTEITRTYYTITYDPSIDEDGFVDIRVYLGTGISSDVTLSFTAGENVFFDGQSTGSLTFTPDELGSTHTKSIRVSLTDDLTISYDQLASISVAFSSADAGPNGESEQIDLSITDNDFQRSIDLTKLPSDGNNKIIYDLDTSANNQWYTTHQAPQSNGQSTNSTSYRSQRDHLYKYDLGSGNE